MKRQFQLSLTAFAIAQCLSLTNAYAQEDTTDVQDPQDATEVITVRGFGSTLTRSLQHKKLADSTVEIISTDDLGQLPDVTITDALARLPGIAADRDRGNPSVISVRGMGPRLNLATMNGREIVSAEPSRDVRYEQFPAELVNSVEVYKSPLASNVEGGISGLVNMNFVSPLDTDKRVFTVSAHGMHYDLGEDLPGTSGNGYRTAISYVDKLSDNFGVALGVAYQDQPSIQRGIESWDYNNAASAQGDINGNGKGEAAPWGGQADTKIGTNERLGALAIVEWAPSDDLVLKYDLFYSKFDIQEREDQMYFTNWGNWGGGQNWNYNNSVTPPNIVTNAEGNEQLAGGGLAWGSHEVHNATWFQTNELISTGINAEWALDDWKVIADLGYSSASINSVWVDIRSSYIGQGYDLGWSVADGDALQVWLQENPDQGLPTLDISQPDQYQLGVEQWVETSPGVWEPFQMGMFADDDRKLTDDMISAKLDFSRYVDWGVFTELQFGTRYSDREKENNVVDWSKAVIADNGLTDYATNYAIGGGIVAPALYAFKDWDQVASQAFGGIDNRNLHTQSDQDKLNSWVLTENNFAAYVMLDMNGEMGSVPYTGNVGLRYVHTSASSAGYQQVGGELSPVDIDHDYTELLPSLNMLFTLSDEFQIRLGMARTMSRPPLIEMRTGFSIDETVEPNTASGGNPTLNPYVANQLDVGFEYYWNETAAATVAFFFKDMTTHIGNATETVNFNGKDYELTGPVNGNGGQIRGVEILYQQAFDMLPAPFDGLGIYTNYSYTDTNIEEFIPENNPYTLAGLSKHVGNLTLWYYKAGFDAKVSMNYRSEFTSINSWNPSRIMLNGAETTVDASISYELTDNLKLMLQAQNLTDEAAVSYWDNDKSRLGDYVQWGRRYLLGFQYAM